jgi:hypothetical protein
MHTRPVQKGSVHYECLVYCSCGLDVNSSDWLVRGGLTAHPLNVIIQWGLSVGSKTPLTKLVYCVIVAFTNLFTFKGEFSFWKRQKSQGAKSGLQGAYRTRLCDALPKEKACMRAIEWAGALS